MLKLDHLAVAAQNLNAGRAWVEDVFGLTLQPGGKHTRYGTHNMLLGLGDGLYLEVIAIDPDAPKLPFPRWFDLDRFTGNPRLNNWICRANPLRQVLQELPGAGQPVALERGDLRWQMAVPDDGVLPYDGMFPALMEWQGTTHPSDRLDASGCKLNKLVVSHPDAAALASELDPVLRDERVDFEKGTAGLRAEFETPHGKKFLG